MDRLSHILEELNVNAGVFFSGQLCGLASFEEGTTGYVHVLRAGALQIIDANGNKLPLDEPSLIFSVRNHAHQLFGSENKGAELVCASIKFQTGSKNPVLEALPSPIIVPLASVHGLDTFIDVLFSEANLEREGRDAVMNRLLEVILVNVLRHIIAEGHTPPSTLSALADRHLAPVLEYINRNIREDLSVERLAEIAAMSRSSFIQHFKNTFAMAPGEYVQNCRMATAKKLIAKRKPMSVICFEVGYEDASSFSRAFKRNTGLTPREWKTLSAEREKE